MRKNSKKKTIGRNRRAAFIAGEIKHWIGHMYLSVGQSSKAWQDLKIRKKRLYTKKKKRSFRNDEDKMKIKGKENQKEGIEFDRKEIIQGLEKARKIEKNIQEKLRGKRK